MQLPGGRHNMNLDVNNLYQFIHCNVGLLQYYYNLIHHIVCKVGE